MNIEHILKRCEDRMLTGFVKRLRPFGFDVRIGEHSGRERRTTVYLCKHVRAKDHYWDEQVIGVDYHLCHSEVWEWGFRDEGNARTFSYLDRWIDDTARDALMKVMYMVMQIPEAVEVDWRPTETIPEDYYAM